ncbi:MAG: L,D-transpeptidase family protein [Desulfovibrionaceae bacterium]|nr:L,D-transpeptidase family protein [Desulfovibrionaceae bacterium]
MPKLASTFFYEWVALLVLFCLGTFTSVCQAENWHTRICDIYLPSHLVAVDKEKQKFFFYEKHSPLRLKYEFTCTTGQKPGDKQVINDLKTPEGIYFVEYKIANGLDFREYGGVAYTLNYPNPVDKLRGKTGHGIWIHSKGFGLVPTKGCVAIGLQEIDTVGPSLTPGTPVIVAEGMSEPNLSKEDKFNAQNLRHLMQAWSHAWSMRSARMFDFYDQEAYSKATQDFAEFRSNKERIFKMVQHIKLINRDIHVLEGPGYWVTWAEQCYTASNHTQEGIRRLYWQKGQDKRFRIVGMEWLPRDFGLLAEYKKGKLVAQGPVTVQDDSSEAPSLPALSMPEDAPLDQVTPKGRRQLIALSDPLVPNARPNNPFKEFNWTTNDPNNPKSPSNLTGEPTPSEPLTEEQIQAQVVEQAKRFTTLLVQKDPKVFDLFSQTKFNRLPGIFKQRSLRSTIHEIERLHQGPDLDLVSRNPQIEVSKNLFITRQEVLIHQDKTTLEGEYRLFWIREDDGQYFLVGLNFLPKPTGLTANWLEKISEPVTKELEKWRKAWESGDVEAYASFYADNALQQGKRGLQHIKRQKAELWSRVKPLTVTLEGLRMMPTSQGLKVDMTQTYIDSSGKKEHGLKTLLLQLDQNNWKIIQEDWQSLPISSRN